MYPALLDTGACMSLMRIDTYEELVPCGATSLIGEEPWIAPLTASGQQMDVYGKTEGKVIFDQTIKTLKFLVADIQDCSVLLGWDSMRVLGNGSANINFDIDELKCTIGTTPVSLIENEWLNQLLEQSQTPEEISM